MAVLGLFGSVDGVDLEKAMQIIEGSGANPQESPAVSTAGYDEECSRKDVKGALPVPPKNQPLTAVVRILKDATQRSARTIRRVQEPPKDTLRSLQSCRILVLACFSLLPEGPIEPRLKIIAGNYRFR